MAKSDLIIQETPLVFQPSLALMIGLNEAIVLQTLQYCCNQKKFGKVHDGKRWIYNTLEQWREFSFPFWTTRTIGEIFRTLETMGLIESDQLDLKKGSAMKYYTVTHSALNILTREKLPHVEESSTPIWKNLPEGKEESSRSARARLVSNITKKQTKTQDADFSEEEKEKSDNELSCPPDQTQADATAKGRTAGAVSKNPTPDCAPPLPELENNKAKLNRMFKRRDTTRWSAKELQALEITLGTTDEEWDALLAYYAHAGKEGYFCRNNLITCLNNWAGEIDKARRGKQAVYPKGNESSPSAPKHTPSGHKLSGREEEFWAWLKAWRPYEKRCDIRSVREDYVWDFLNGVVHEPEEPVTEIRLPRVEEDLF